MLARTLGGFRMAYGWVSDDAPYMTGYLRHESPERAVLAVTPYYPHPPGSGIKEDRYITLRLNELQYIINPTNHESVAKGKK